MTKEGKIYFVSSKKIYAVSINQKLNQSNRDLPMTSCKFAYTYLKSKLQIHLNDQFHANTSSYIQTFSIVMNNQGLVVQKFVQFVSGSPEFTHR